MSETAQDVEFAFFDTLRLKFGSVLFNELNFTRFTLSEEMTVQQARIEATNLVAELQARHDHVLKHFGYKHARDVLRHASYG